MACFSTSVFRGERGEEKPCDAHQTQIDPNRQYIPAFNIFLIAGLGRGEHELLIAIDFASNPAPESWGRCMVVGRCRDRQLDDIVALAIDGNPPWAFSEDGEPISDSTSPLPAATIFSGLLI